MTNVSEMKIGEFYTGPEGIVVKRVQGGLIAFFEKKKLDRENVFQKATEAEKEKLRRRIA